MLDELETIVENARNALSLWATPAWPSLTKIKDNIFKYSNAPGASQHSDFKKFLTERQPSGWTLGQTWPASWNLEELNTYYRKVVQKVPYVLALIGEFCTHENNPSKLNERIESVYNAFHDRLPQDDSIMIRRFADQLKNKLLTDVRALSKTFQKALCAQEKIQQFGIRHWKNCFNIFKAFKDNLGDVVSSHFTDLKENWENNLMSVKKMAPTSQTFIDGIKEKIASIDPEKKTRVLRLDNNFLDNMLTVDKDTVANCWHNEKNLKGGTILALIEYTKSNDTLNFEIEKRRTFRHKDDGSWELRLMQKDNTNTLVPTLYTITQEEQDLIVRDLLERNVLTPLKKLGLIADHTEEEQKEEEVPVENIISAARNEYYENKKTANKF